MSTREEEITIEVAPQTTSQLVAEGEELIAKWIPSWAALGMTSAQAVGAARACEELAIEDARVGKPARHWSEILGQVKGSRWWLFESATSGVRQ